MMLFTLPACDTFGRCLDWISTSRQKQAFISIFRIREENNERSLLWHYALHSRTRRRTQELPKPPWPTDETTLPPPSKTRTGNSKHSVTFTEVGAKGGLWGSSCLSDSTSFRKAEITGFSVPSRAHNPFYSHVSIKKRLVYHLNGTCNLFTVIAVPKFLASF